MPHKFLDQFGYEVRAGRRYAVGKSRSTGVVCEAFECPDSGDLMIRQVRGNAPPQRLYGEDIDYALDSHTKFTLVDEHGVEVTDAKYVDDSQKRMVIATITKARHHKDQLAGLEQTLIHETGAHDDSEMRDAIMQAIHADGSPDKIFELMGVA